ncbi:accessory gene regulator B family protein [Clostridium luticellarii]|jgi:accessory gene regulator B|uniref:accessory gene regulator B family protein n=1 Tax=Clostridium luticellarii TaxID=1691940 RepID=UPI0023560FC0|nr:accessory gene regulator B family protein [Clostridium luticellarii]MCI1969471.1 accessory gene regulator B family protein [Clostridium luticellarii]MCI1996787.1 accessory gene regulator B family protein [Clostridium luticellarii]MCI2039638.1 accessory gene regulator B family protein [Clostridium luticellarii]
MCVKFIAKNLKKSDIELKEVNYGIQVFLINTIKLAILFLLAFILGILKYTLIALISFAFIRMFAAGVHARSNLGCTITNIILFIGNVYLSMNVVLEKPVKTVIFIISLSLITIYAPSDTEERPLISKRLRKKLKACSILCSIVLTLSAEFIALKYKNYEKIV